MIVRGNETLRTVAQARAQINRVRTDEEADYFDEADRALRRLLTMLRMRALEELEEDDAREARQ